jgi:hypothetical protein
MNPSRPLRDQSPIAAESIWRIIGEMTMAMLYQHTQYSALSLVVAVLAVLMFAGAFFLGTVPRIVLICVSIVVAASALFFSALTVEVTKDDLRWHFALPLWTYQIARADIENVQVVRNAVSNGSGIRMGAHSRLYNISGLDAVEIELKTGDIRRIRIGTDDAPGLAAALKS